MKKKGVKPDFLFKRKDSEEVSTDDFKIFTRNTLNVTLKKREEHALFVLCDTNKNNTINKDEFLNFYKKGERLLDSPPKPMRNNFLTQNEDEDYEDKSPKRKSKRIDTDRSYSGDAKQEIIRAIHDIGSTSIESFFTETLHWNEKDMISFDKFYKKTNSFFENIPEDDLHDFFDELDMGDNKIKVKNIIKELKSQVKQDGDDLLSLLTAEDIQPRYGSMSPRSASSFFITEIKEHSDANGVKLEEVFKSCREGRKTYVTRDNLNQAMRQNLPKLSRSIIEKILTDFGENKITYTDYLIFFNLKDTAVKSGESSSNAQQKWIKKYTSVLMKHKITPEEIGKEADRNKDGRISIEELEKVLKESISDKEISFKDLKHIMDAFDINNDGAVTIKEYNAAVKKYSSKDTDSEDNIFKKAAHSCKAKGVMMKQAFGECRFNDKAEITKSSFLRTIPKVTGMDKNDVVQLFYAIEEDPQANSLSGEKIFKYFEEILHMEDNIS